MAKDWLSVITANADAWGLPQSTPKEFGGVLEAAETALDTAENETTRTPVATARCKAAFDDLAAHMRDIKRRYFLSPPLAEADFVSLGLKPHDPHPTPLGPPTAQVTVETFLAGRHELGIKMVYVSGSPDDPANKGFRVWYSVTGQDEAPPASPEDLHKSFFTKRKKDVMEFDYGESGKRVYLAVQVENEGKKGAWGPMVSALIP
jgi:hypothetical protein